MNLQIENLEHFLDWLKTCPYQTFISSQSGGYVHVKIMIPYEK